MYSLSIWQHRQYKKTPTDPTRPIPPGTSKLVVQAAVRIGVPDIGLSYIQMPWIDTPVTLPMIKMLLKVSAPRATSTSLLQKYVSDAETWITKRQEEGLAPLVPSSYRHMTEEERNEALPEAELSDEEEAKRLTKLYNQWINGILSSFHTFTHLQKGSWLSTKSSSPKSILGNQIPRVSVWSLNFIAVLEMRNKQTRL